MGAFVSTWLGFLVLRMIALFLFIVVFPFDMKAAHEAGGMGVNYYQQAIGYTTAVGLFVLSGFWFMKLTKQALRQIRSNNNKSQ